MFPSNSKSLFHSHQCFCMLGNDGIKFYNHHHSASKRHAEFSFHGVKLYYWNFVQICYYNLLARCSHICANFIIRVFSWKTLSLSIAIVTNTLWFLTDFILIYLFLNYFISETTKRKSKLHNSKPYLCINDEIEFHNLKMVHKGEKLSHCAPSIVWRAYNSCIEKEMQNAWVKLLWTWKVVTSVHTHLVTEKVLRAYLVSK